LVLVSIDGFAPSAHITASDASKNQLTISGGLTDVTAVALSVMLETGAMPVTLSVRSTSSGSLIGQDMVSRTLMLLAISFVVFLLYLLAYYRGLGLTAVLGMIVFALLNLGVLALLSFYGFFVLTIPAVAAVALSCVVAADSILLIIERIREEITLGRLPRTSTTNALGSAERGSIDSTIILLLVGLLVLIIDSGSLRPFGVALAVGTACSLLVTVFFTAPALKLLSYELFASNPGLWGVNEPAGKASTTDESN
jgi:SecD/SecF fusion protein